MLAQVRIHDPRRVYDLYPHEVSGGMGQRIMIAMMLIPEPELLIADEPTSALDEPLRDTFMQVLVEDCVEAGSALLFVSHDPRLSAGFDRSVDIAELRA